jgi:single-stranded-DNA-specific exonuclease
MNLIDQSTSESDILSILLKNRSIGSENIAEFLKPISPKSLPITDFGVSQANLQKAIEKINLSIKNKQNILIYGDYDVDGITATAILWQVLYQHGAKVLPFVPDREADGYGIKADSFFKFEAKNKLKFDLLITVDNGIVANSALEKIGQSGTDIIVIDHHVADEKLPASIITVHSTKVSGSVLSWIVAKEIDKQADLGLAALGTITDCLPLNTVNRNIVYHGLETLRKNPNCGIKKLIQISGINPDSISTYDLGFVLGPRINAVGRLSNPTDALRLLCSCSDTQATKFAQILDNYNKDRQSLQQESIDLAQKQVKKNKDRVLFISDKLFHPGIIGLIAGRFTEKYYLPSIVINLNDDVSKGSCRSIKELNIIESLREVSDLFIDLGGHAGAAGFSIQTKNIPKFKKEITKIINQKLEGKVLKPEKLIDAEMTLSAVNLKNCRLVKKLEPFGIGNLEPLFLFKNLQITQKRLLGSKQEHLKLNFSGIDAIAFKKGDLDKSLKAGDSIDVTARLNLNTWGGSTSPQLIIADILPINS